MMRWPAWVPDGQPEARAARNAWINAHADEYHPDELIKPRKDNGCPVDGCPWVTKAPSLTAAQIDSLNHWNERTERTG